jgi:hypothetical protein
MSERVDPALQLVADKILHDLPEELAATLAFKLHEGGDALVLSYPVSLHGSPDMKLIDVAARRFGGAFVSRGKDNSYYLIPKPKVQPVAEKPKEEAKPEVKPAAPVEAPKPVDVKTAEPSVPVSQSNNCNKVTESPSAVAEPEKPVSPQEQPEEPFKQPSPISIYRQKYCSACEDHGTCRLPGNAVRMQLCIRILEVQFLDSIGERLFKLGQSLDGVDSRLSALTAKISVSALLQSTKMPDSLIAPLAQQSPKVPPKPETSQQSKGGVEDWVRVLKWEPAKTNSGKDCEKAYELNNLNGNLLKDEYVHLLDELKRRKAANEKNYVAGYLFFHTEQGDSPYIGRLAAKDFSKGARR